jgi:hypothetical protein
MHKRGLNYSQSLSRLDRARGFVSEAVGEDVERRLKSLLRSSEVERSKVRVSARSLS